MTTARQIANMLLALPKAKLEITKLCTVRIGRNSYPAVQYRETLQIDPTTRAYQEGKREYTRDMMYAVGMLPREYCRSSHIAFSRADDTRVWYVASYYGAVQRRVQEVKPVSEFHPFGNSIIFAPWDAADPIDKYESKPYTVLDMVIETEESDA